MASGVAAPSGGCGANVSGVTLITPGIAAVNGGYIDMKAQVFQAFQDVYYMPEEVPGLSVPSSEVTP